MVRFRARIPEQNTLTVQVWDKDFICDEMIGQFSINMLDRALSANYMSIKHKPVEDRELYDDISSQPKGRVRYIFEMFRTTQETSEPAQVDTEDAQSNSHSSLKNLSVDLTKTFIANKMQHKNKKIKVKNTTDTNGVETTTTTQTLTEEDLLKLHPVISISKLPTRKFNIRLIIWNGENIPAMDLGGSSDV